MRTWLSAAVAAGVLIFAMAGVASAAPGSNGNGNSKGKGSLPPIDTSQRGQLRLHRRARQRALPAAVPRRLLHASRREQPDRAPRRLQDRRRCRPTPSAVHIDADPLQRLRRLQPRRDDPAQGARDRHRRRRPRDRRGADQPHRPATASGNAPVVVIDASTGKRWPIWVEIDSHRQPTPRRRRWRSTRRSTSPPATATSSPCATSATPPAQKIEAPAAFRYYRDNVPSKQDEINARRGHFEAIFKRLQQLRHPPQRASTWPGTSPSPATRTTPAASSRCATTPSPSSATPTSPTASPQGSSPTLPGDRASKRNRTPARSRAGSKAPSMVPCYLFPSCGPGGTMQLDADGDADPERHLDRQLRLHHPRVGGHRRRPAPAGRRSTVTASSAAPARSPRARSAASPRNTRSSSARPTRSACRESDVPVAIGALQDLSRFPAIPDRLQQGLLDELYLGRAMISPSGFTTDAAFHQDGTLRQRPRCSNTSHLFYNGNSQGGIMGGALTAVSPDFTRASLGVPAMNYSVLLPRSVDFDPFAGGPLSLLPGRTVAAAGPRPDPDALGPRRARTATRTG